MGNMISCCEVHTDDWDGHPDLPAYHPSTPAGVTLDDMSMPLSYYYISSGHNSYLTGNQLTADSGTQTIEMCLKQNCRVIELDVYNQQGDFDGPVCKHGGTLTAPVSFKVCVEAVGRFSFVNSPYPVIITMENHTDEANQKRMAEILQSSLGSLLYIPELGEAGTTWKSPDQLKNKILLRTNAGKACPELRRLIYIANTKFKSLQDANDSGKTSSSSFDEIKAKKLLKTALEASGVPTKAEANRSQSQMFRLESIKKINGSFKKPAESAANAALEAPADDIPDEVVSSVHSLAELYVYTATNLMRVYPGGLRVDSSNYTPTIAWSAGASFAALNWQKWDQALWINSALFSLNGGCGYVLKPPWMLEPATARLSNSGTMQNPLPKRRPRTLAVTVYSAYVRQYGQFACFKDDVYVQMDLVGMPMDNQQQRTDVANNTGRLLVNKTYNFKVHFLEIAILVIKVRDEDMPGGKVDDDLGHWEVPLANLAQGEYKVHLTDSKKRLRQDRWIKVRLEWLKDDLHPHHGESMDGIENPRISHSNQKTLTGPQLSKTQPVVAPAAAANQVANPLATAATVAADATNGDTKERTRI